MVAISQVIFLAMAAIIVVVAPTVQPGTSVKNSSGGLQTEDYHYDCELGSLVGTQLLWSPAILLNSPYLGSASGFSAISTTASAKGVFTMPFGSVDITQTETQSTSQSFSIGSGQAAGGFFLYQWDVYSIYTQSFPSAGVQDPCTSSYTAMLTGKPLVFQVIPIPIGGSYNPATSDANEANTVQGYYKGQYYPSVSFDNSYGSSNFYTESTCAYQPTTEGNSNQQTTNLGLTVTVPTSKGPISVSGQFDMSTSTTNAFTYNFPAGYAWEQDYLGIASGAGGMAFSWQNNCPPASPSGLNAPSVSGDYVMLGWTNPTQGAPLTANTIYWGESCATGSGWANSAKTGAPVTGYEVSGLSPSTSYCFAVTAWNQYGQSLDSATITVSTSSSSGGGGGGCVGLGTQILTTNGTAPVQNLAPGTAIVEYNLSNGQLATGKFISANESISASLLNINNGTLTLTPTDQPIYMHNNSYVGWLHDPQNLTVGAYIFDPVDGTWIMVTSLVLVQGDFKVYDVVTSGFNNFVGNGFLLDIKCC
jgi:hypothetical protein